MPPLVFAARYYCISPAYAVMRCLSVCPSVTFVDFVKTSNLILGLFSLLGSQTILVFAYQTLWRYSDGGVECRWGRLKSRFSTNISNCYTVVSLSHLVTRFLLTEGIGRPSATRYKQSSSSVIMYSARQTKRGLVLYTVTVDRESCV